MCIDTREALTWWTADPLALGVTGLPSLVYGVGVARLWRTVGTGHGVQRWEAASFFTGQLALLVALVSPVDRLSDILFSAHMTQHEIIMLVAPLLVVLGRPWVAASWALPARARQRLWSVAAQPPLRRVWRGATAPVLVVLVHALVVWLWHEPRLFEAALRDEAVHAVQHSSFFVTAALFWFAVLRGRYGRLGYGVAAAFVFATAMHTSILGALITVAGGLWYPLYAARARPYAMDALQDQQLAGLVMWIPAGVVLTLVALALVAAWLGEARRRVVAAERKRAA